MFLLHLLQLIFQEYSALASGCAVRRVTCEHCGEHYIYQLRITAKGCATSLRFMNKTATRQRAQARAEKKLQHRLAVDSRPPPCPACGHYQHDMILLIRRRHLRTFGLATFFLGVALAILWIMEEQFPSPALTTTTQLLTVIVIAALLGTPVWIFLHDVNRTAHRRTRAALGTDCQAMPADEFDALLADQAPDLFTDEIV